MSSPSICSLKQGQMTSVFSYALDSGKEYGHFVRVCNAWKNALKEGGFVPPVRFRGCFFSCKRKNTHKNRLLIGEGNFSFALALIQKHDSKASHPLYRSLGHTIVATELKENLLCEMCQFLEKMEQLSLSSTDEREAKRLCNSCLKTKERVEKLRKRGVKIELGVDGIRIHEKFKNQTFRRIHWNCPHDGSSFKKQTLPKLLFKFFRSCSQVQRSGDRVHITLAQPSENKDFYQGYYYNIVEATWPNRYILIRKRKFSASRYKSYQHVQTKKDEKASVTEQGMREFVFEKHSLQEWIQCSYSKRVLKACTIKEKECYQEKRLYFDCSTDEDSSDCGE